MDVFQDGQGQYILASNGQRIDGWWQLEDDADPAVLIGPDGTVVSGAGELLAARQHATKNRVEIEASALCGCFYCLSLFKPQAIKDWLDFDAGELDSDATTACCPERDMDCVLGSASCIPITQEFLRRMQARWFPDP